MRLFKIKRKTRIVNIYHKNMGTLKTTVTKIKKTFLGIPFKTIHVYRETYHGDVKDIGECEIGEI